MATISAVLLAVEVLAASNGAEVVVGASNAVIIGSGVATSAGSALADGATPDSAAAVYLKLNSSLIT